MMQKTDSINPPTIHIHYKNVSTKRERERENHSVNAFICLATGYR